MGVFIIKNRERCSGWKLDVSMVVPPPSDTGLVDPKNDVPLSSLTVSVKSLQEIIKHKDQLIEARDSYIEELHNTILKLKIEIEVKDGLS